MERVRDEGEGSSLNGANVLDGREQTDTSGLAKSRNSPLPLAGSFSTEFMQPNSDVAK